MCSAGSRRPLLAQIPCRQPVRGRLPDAADLAKFYDEFTARMRGILQEARVEDGALRCARYAFTAMAPEVTFLGRNSRRCVQHRALGYRRNVETRLLHVGKSGDSRQPRIGHLREHAHVAGADVLARFRGSITIMLRAPSSAAMRSPRRSCSRPACAPAGAAPFRIMPATARASRSLRRRDGVHDDFDGTSRFERECRAGNDYGEKCECEFHESPCSIARRRHVFNFEKTGTSRMRSAATASPPNGRETRMMTSCPPTSSATAAEPAPSRRPGRAREPAARWVISSLRIR